MKATFYKYQGAGNDFVVVANTNVLPFLDQGKIAQICDRRFGIGADGFIILNSDPSQGDVEMIYYNSDGRLSSFCGNGSRCTAQCAHVLGLAGISFVLKASDGLHHAKIINDEMVAVSMLVKDQVTGLENDEYFVDTGSPHLISLKDDIKSIDVNLEGKKIRNRPQFKAEGVNVNFVKQLSSYSIEMRTYERGVEAETLSCGTGVTAAAIVNSFLGNFEERSQDINTPGGQLKVELSKSEDPLKEVLLIGPAVKVFTGTLEI